MPAGPGGSLREARERQDAKYDVEKMKDNSEPDEDRGVETDYRLNSNKGKLSQDVLVPLWEFNQRSETKIRTVDQATISYKTCDALMIRR